MLKNFLNDEAGAVTIDWVALTAGILLLGIAVVYGIFNEGVTNLATDINTNLNSAVGVTIDPNDVPGVDNFDDAAATE